MLVTHQSTNANSPGTIVATILFFFTLVALSGCDEAANNSIRIAVIPKGTTHEFWRSVHAGAERAAQEAGNVEVVWKGPLQESDRDGQVNVIDDFIVQQLEGICVAPLDSQALIAPVRAAQDAGIPTVIFDSGLDDERLPVSYVATDNYRGGVLAAQRLAEVMGSEGGAILMRYQPGSESTLEREEGFLTTLRDKYPDIKILSSDQYAGTTPEQALDNCQQILLKYRDDVNGVFTVCEPNSTGMLGALDNAGLAGKVHFIAFDPNGRLIEAMANGKIDGIVVQDPINMGYLSVKTMLAHLRGEKVERFIDTGEYMATPENMHTPQMERLLHPVKFGE